MRKIFLLIFILVLFGINDLFALTNYTETSLETECEGQVLSDASGKKYIPIANNTSAPTSDNFNCEQHGYYSGTWSSRIANGNHYLCPTDGYASIIEYSGANYRVYCKMVDDTPPLTNDILSSLDSSAYHTASSSKNISITIETNGGSPITLIEAKFEKESNQTQYYDYSSTSSVLTKNLNISKVDNYINPNNYRDYTYKITKVCDEAENCSTNIKDFIYHVYAGNVSSTNSNIIGTNNFDDEIADGTEKTLTVQLKDASNNNIVQVKNALNNIIRNVTLKIPYSNTLHLNQLVNSGTDTAVFADIITPIIGSNTAIITNDSDGNYNIKFKVYAPTSNTNGITQTQAKGNFTITDILGSVSDITGDISLNSAIDFQFKPIYYTDITGELANDGFVEGKTQTGSIDINKNGSSNPVIDGLYFVQTGTKKDNFTSTGRIDTDSRKDIIISDSLIGTKFLSSFNITTDYIFEILFTLVDGVGFIDDIKDIRLNEYIRYIIAGKTVTYLAGILNDNNNQNFETLKIYGITNIDKDKQKDLTENQGDNDVQNLAGEIVKASLKKDLQKAAISTIKFTTTNNVNGNGSKNISDLSGNNWNNIDGKDLGNILYFGDLDGETLDGENIVLNTNNKLEGRKTIIIKGGNLYIKSNIINNSPSDILGIIVLEDENGKGGKVYIDTSVQEVDAIIYTDKSVMSYNMYYNNGNSDNIIKHEIDGNIDNLAIQNQLYIYGTVFSENTIGGSRIDPPVCPFWIESDSSITCNTIEAQKYDFNYLRAGSNNKYNASYADYPVIIKYNSTVQSTPPPLFDK